MEEEVVCPVDAQFSEQISLLLQPPSPLQQQEYFIRLLTSKNCHGILQVKPSKDYGKGVYADTDFKEDDLVFKDEMLVGVQHSSNKIDCLVCSCCFCFIGSIELQIGRKLYLQGLGSQKDCSSSEDSDIGDHSEAHKCPSNRSTSKYQLPTETVESLMHEELALPYSKKFPLPSVIDCPGGCKEVYYCSKSCAQADWDACHSLLCTGKGSDSLRKKSILKFIQHANEMNDIFLLAAKVVSSIILNYRKLKEAFNKDKEEEKEKEKEKEKPFETNKENSIAEQSQIDGKSGTQSNKDIQMMEASNATKNDVNNGGETIQRENGTAIVENQKPKELLDAGAKAKLLKTLHQCYDNPMVMDLCASLFPENPKSLWNRPHSLVHRHGSSRKSSIGAAIATFLKY